MSVGWKPESLLTKFVDGAMMRCVPTASLPAADVDLDGLILVERTASSIALVVYGNDGAGVATRARVTLTEF